MCLQHNLDEGLLSAAQLAKYVLAVARLKVRGSSRVCWCTWPSSGPLEQLVERLRRNPERQRTPGSSKRGIPCPALHALPARLCTPAQASSPTTPPDSAFERAQ